MKILLYCNLTDVDMDDNQDLVKDQQFHNILKEQLQQAMMSYGDDDNLTNDKGNLDELNQVEIWASVHQALGKLDHCRSS